MPLLSHLILALLVSTVLSFDPVNITSTLENAAGRHLSSTPTPCLFSQETTGTHIVPQPNCQLTRQIVVSGDFTCLGVKDEVPRRELKAVSGVALANLPRRLFILSVNAKLTLQDLKLSGGRVIDSHDGGNIQMSHGQLVIIRCEYLVGHSLPYTADKGAFIYATGSAQKITITFSTFDGTGSKSKDHGGFIHCNTGTMAIHVADSTFKNWWTKEQGGVIYMDQKDTTWTSTRTTYESNSALEGGVAVAKGKSKWISTHDKFINNVARTGNGGAFSIGQYTRRTTHTCAHFGDLQIKNRQECRDARDFLGYSGDTSGSWSHLPPGCSQWGSGIHYNTYASGRSCDYSSGNFCLCRSGETFAKFTDSTFTGNQAKKYGGAIAAFGNSKVLLHGGQNYFKSNQCTTCNNGRRDANVIYSVYGIYSNHFNIPTCKKGTFQDSSRQTKFGLDFWGCEYSCPAGTSNEAPAESDRRNTNPDTWCTVPCPKGFYCSGGIGGTLPCPAGVYGNALALKTSDCTAPCPLNFYCPEGSVNPKKCPNGLSTTITGGKSEDDCVSCSLGTVTVTTDPLECQICPMGYYNDDASADAVCKTCPKGRYNDDGTDVEGTDRLLHDNIDDCNTCSRGMYFVSSVDLCHVCAEGKYQPQLNVDGVKCIECPSAKYILDQAKNAVKHDSPSDCLGCPAGWEFINVHSECLICRAGRYQDEADSSETECKRCEAGTFNPDDRVDDSKHDDERDCADCDEGFWSNKGFKFCKQCTSGKVKRVDNATQETLCLECASGKIAPEPGLPNCTKCRAGEIQPDRGKTYCIPCGAGKRAVDGQKCLDCKIGRYQNTVGQISCTECKAGSFQSQIAQSFCLPCIPGSFQNKPAQTFCTKCERDFFSSETGQKKCSACPKGRGTSNIGSASCGDCGMGSFKNTTTQTCLDCPRGFFTDQVGQTSCSSCQPGQFAMRNRAGSCLDCVPGKYQDETSSTSCVLCEANTYASDSKQINCLDCEVGKTSTSGSAACQTCKAGEAGKPCTKCQAGLYRGNTDDAKSCLSCQPGYFTSIVGQSFCLDCDTGKYAENEGSILCQQCLKGQYNDDKRATTCKFCTGTDIPNDQQVGCVRSPFRLPDDCKRGTEFLNDSSTNKYDWTCETCIVGADCSDFPVLSELKPLEDYRQLTWTNKEKPGYGACPTPLACHWNYTNDGCHVGHDPNASELCSTCLTGYASRSKTELCSKCPGRAGTIVIFMLTCICVMLVFAYLVYDSLDGAADMIPNNDDENDVFSTDMPFHSIAIRIVSSFLQTSSMLLSFDIALPPSVRTLLTIEMSASSLSSELMQFDCVTDERDDGEMFLLKQISAVWIIPSVAVFICFLFWFGVFVVRRVRKARASLSSSTEVIQASGKHRIEPFSGFVASLMVLFYTVFPSVLNRVALTLSCRKFHDRTLLTEALSIRCGSPRHIVMISVVGIPGMLLFALIIPGTLAFLLFRQRRRQKLYPSQKNYDAQWTVEFGFMFAGYEIGYEWWESVVMLRKCCFVMLAIFLRRYGAAAQVTAASMTLIAALSLHLQYQPFAVEGLDRLESYGLHATLLMLLTALMCNMLSVDTERNALDISDFQKRSQLGPKSTVLMIVVVFCSTFSFFFCVAHGIILSSQEDTSKEDLVNVIARGCAQQFPRCCRNSKTRLSKSDKRNAARRRHLAQVHPNGGDAGTGAGTGAGTDIEAAFAARMNKMLDDFFASQQSRMPPPKSSSPPATASARFQRATGKLGRHGTRRGSLKYNVKVAHMLKKAKDQHVTYGETLAARNRTIADRHLEAKTRLQKRVHSKHGGKKQRAQKKNEKGGDENEKGGDEENAEVGKTMEENQKVNQKEDQKDQKEDQREQMQEHKQEQKQEYKQEHTQEQKKNEKKNDKKHDKKNDHNKEQKTKQQKTEDKKEKRVDKKPKQVDEIKIVKQTKKAIEKKRLASQPVQKKEIKKKKNVEMTEKSNESKKQNKTNKTQKKEQPLQKTNKTELKPVKEIKLLPQSKCELQILRMLQQTSDKKCKKIFKSFHKEENNGGVVTAELMFKKLFEKLQMPRKEFDVLFVRMSKGNQHVTLEQFLTWVGK